MGNACNPKSPAIGVKGSTRVAMITQSTPIAKGFAGLLL
jgi:hypothetical protein